MVKSGTTQVTLTFGQPLGQADLWSDILLTPTQPYAPIAPTPHPPITPPH